MKMLKKSMFVLGLAVLSVAMQSCDNDDCYVTNFYRPTALVTVHPIADNKFIMHLDDSTVLYPTNLTSSPFGDKEVRALVNYTYDEKSAGTHDVYVYWLDSIRTKMPVISQGEDNDQVYGHDPIEIVKDWVTVAEDGYLTLRIRTRWGASNTPHLINLLTGTNPDDPYELELRHHAQGDTDGEMGDALIAFNLNKLLSVKTPDIRIKLTWESFSGKKSTEFDLKLRPVVEPRNFESVSFNKRLE